MLQPGASFAGYRLENVLGSGGMGVVYVARHPELPRSDALKILKADVGISEEFRTRFLREAELSSTLDHPNIVAIYNRGTTDDGELWIAMQYVNGTDAAKELKESNGGLPLARAVYIVGEIARGIDHAHRKGLLHRDIKPANILLSTGDKNEDLRVLLADFGVAKFTEDTDHLTSLGTVLATVSYASPEQLQGDPVTKASDQYSLAATFFHLVAGRVPFPGANTVDVVRKHFTESVPPLSALKAGVPPGVDSVIARAMAKRAEDRYPTCRDFFQALQYAATHPDAALGTAISNVHGGQLNSPQMANSGSPVPSVPLAFHGGLQPGLPSGPIVPQQPVGLYSGYKDAKNYPSQEKPSMTQDVLIWIGSLVLLVLMVIFIVLLVS